MTRTSQVPESPRVVVLTGKEIEFGQVPVRPYLRDRIKNSMKRTLAVPKSVKDAKERRKRAKEPPAEIKDVSDKAVMLAQYLESMDRAAAAENDEKGGSN